MKILLHMCCAPCACACLPRLRSLGHDVTLFYSNSNLATNDEFAKRLASAEILAKVDAAPLVVDAYDHDAWLRDAAAGYETAPEKGARCARCFRFNLRRAAKFARENGFDAFTTSLTISPHKVSATIFAMGHAAAEAENSRFFEIDFKKQEGFKLSVSRAKELNLYRQSFCGCEFSIGC